MYGNNGPVFGPLIVTCLMRISVCWSAKIPPKRWLKWFRGKLPICLSLQSVTPWVYMSSTSKPSGGMDRASRRRRWSRVPRPVTSDCNRRGTKPLKKRREIGAPSLFTQPSGPGDHKRVGGVADLITWAVHPATRQDRCWETAAFSKRFVRWSHIRAGTRLI